MDIRVPRVYVEHHGLKHLPVDVGYLDGVGLFLEAVDGEHGAKGLTGGHQGQLVRVEGATVHDEDDVA